MSLTQALLQASELGIRLEIVNGLPICEAQPLCRHQKHVERIARSIERPRPGERGCDCCHALDVYIQFPNGLKRPDIRVFCQEPPEEMQDVVLTMIPEAVIEGHLEKFKVPVWGRDAPPFLSV